MALIIADRVQEATPTTGTSSYTLTGAEIGFQSFGAVMANGDTTYYAVTDNIDWEVGVGTYSTTGPTMARTTILASSNGGAAVNWSTVNKSIFLSYAAGRSVYLDETGDLSVDGTTFFVDAANNRIGIGTTSPSQALDVNGSIITTGGTTDQRGMFLGHQNNINSSYVGRSENGVTNTANRIKFNYADDSLSFDVNAAERMRITSAGLVGIGTVSPAAQLQVSGTTTNIAQFTASITGTTMDVTAVATGTIAVGDIVYGANIAPITRIAALGTGTGGVGTYTVSVSQTAASSAITYTGSPSASRIRISDTDVSSQTGQPAGSIEFFGSDTNTPGAGIGAYVSAVSEDGSPDTALTFGTRDDAGGGVDANERMRITSSGNVGIGTASPTTRLQVSAASSGATGVAGLNTLTVENSGGAGIAILTPNTDFGSIAFGDPENGAIGRIRYNHSTDDMTFNTNAAERMRITSAGNVGIGTASPASALDVLGGIRSTSVGGNSQIITTSIGDTTFANNGVNWLTVKNGAPADTMRVTSTGDVGVGTSSPAAKLDVIGDIRLEGTTPALRFAENDTTDIDGRVRLQGGDLLFETVTDANVLVRENMRITDAGRVGINTSSPTTALDVNGVASAVFFENPQTITASYTIASGKNAMSVGPVTVDAGATITVSAGARYVVI